jgi:hypothetical protein
MRPSSCQKYNPARRSPPPFVVAMVSKAVHIHAFVAIRRAGSVVSDVPLHRDLKSGLDMTFSGIGQRYLMCIPPVVLSTGVAAYVLVHRAGLHYLSIPEDGTKADMRIRLLHGSRVCLGSGVIFLHKSGYEREFETSETGGQLLCHCVLYTVTRGGHSRRPMRLSVRQVYVLLVSAPSFSM